MRRDVHAPCPAILSHQRQVVRQRAFAKHHHRCGEVEQRPSAVGDVAHEICVDDLRDASGALSMSANYAYDGVGRLTDVTGAQPESFLYDSLNRLDTPALLARAGK